MTDLVDTTEMYLRTILDLEEEAIVPLRARISERLGHSGPTVSQTIARMERDGLVVVSGDRHLELTIAGRTKAVHVLRKHRLAERLLSDVIGLDWEFVHEEACRWEHVISDEVEDRLFELLGHPTTCPHGNPIPGSGPQPMLDLVALSELHGGEQVHLERVTEQVEIDLEALAYLSEAGFIPGTDAKVTGRAPDGTLTLALGDHTIALGPALAQQIYVTSPGVTSAEGAALPR